MKRHLIAVDLDGTLLTDNKTILKRTKSALMKAMEKGHHVVISTGRPYRASKSYYHELGLKTPIVNFNGAYVHHPRNPDWGVYHTPLELDTARALIKTCENYDLANIMVEVKDDVYIRNPEPETLEAFNAGDPKVITGDVNNTLQDNPTCVLIQPHKQHVVSLIKDLEKHHADAVQQRSWGEPWNIIEVIRPGINKAVGLRRVAADLDIPAEHIIAFGDEDNDIDMLQYAGQGIAMGNAMDDIKKAADKVTATNEEDGIAQYLENELALV
ncbi:hypothetical protein EV207_10863 [Scopulibacillus darangshiensis]|uniref:Cof subfamily protein (Haloacid dehalogenase superfamily)/HAD superfamily hydrolase (TIGR01484 family) n=1 Tax=Scopulibacillus darangshiensis TaxID=442528 RepID=A0A4R2P706_9BACL|nr:Cof-type HAD-IIB family hydrolase [Scopulibacillus darangshiensis]TCP29771.1 hypothetical protein EV207_10863 [Scopulibacillus darangshiensis]